MEAQMAAPARIAAERDRRNTVKHIVYGLAHTSLFLRVNHCSVKTMLNAR